MAITKRSTKGSALTHAEMDANIDEISTRSTATTFNADTSHPDNVKAKFGGGNDLEVVHDGTHSYINEVGTGDLRITSTGSGIFLNKGTTENMGRFLTDGAVELYYDNSKKIETTSTGVDVTGTELSITDSGTPEITINGQGRANPFSMQVTASETKVFEKSNNALAFGTNNTERLRIDSSGNVGIGVTPDTWSTVNAIQVGAFGSLVSQTATTAGGSTELRANSYYDGSHKYQNTDEASRYKQVNGTHVFDVAASGTADTAVSWTTGFEITNGGYPKSERTYANTTAAGANMVVEGAYTYARSVSSAKHKANIETMQDSYADAVLKMRPVWFNSKCDLDNPDWGYWGLIAEEVAELDPRLVFWKTEEHTEVLNEETGEMEQVSTPLVTPEAEGVQYDRIVPHLINLIQRQSDKIEALEARVAALEV